MKKIAIIVVNIFIFSCGREKVSERIFLPKNFEGIAMVYYDVPDSEEEKEDDEGWKLIEFPENGFLLTQYSLPKRALYRREFYLKTAEGVNPLSFLAVGDSRNDLVNFKGIDTTQKYIFSMKGGSYCCGERRSGKGGVDFNYEFFIYCKPRQFKIISNKIYWNLDKLNEGISQCKEDELCYNKPYMERKFKEILK